MNVPEKQLLYLETGMDVVHAGIKDYLEHHPGMAGTAVALFVEFAEIIQIQTVNNGIDDADGVIFRNVFIHALRKKHRLVAHVMAKV